MWSSNLQIAGVIEQAWLCFKWLTLSSKSDVDDINESAKLLHSAADLSTYFLSVAHFLPLPFTGNLQEVISQKEREMEKSNYT